MVTVDRTLLEAALVGYERQRDDIEAKIAEIRRHISGAPATAETPAKGRKRTMNAAARQRIAEAQKKRWAAYKKSHGSTTKTAKVKKRVLSAAAVKHISEATKKRWEAYRAAKAASEKGGAKGTRKSGKGSRRTAQAETAETADT